MIERKHPLVSPSPGTTRELLSLHYGPDRHRPQGRDPGLAARRRGARAAGRAPPAPPARRARGAAARCAARSCWCRSPTPSGCRSACCRRARAASTSRAARTSTVTTPTLLPRAAERVEARCGGDEARNAAAASSRPARGVRRAARDAPSSRACAATLLALATDAEVVLDLHCDDEAVLHLYTAHPAVAAGRAAGAPAGRQATLLAADAPATTPSTRPARMAWPQLADELHEAPRPPGGAAGRLRRGHGRAARRGRREPRTRRRAMPRRCIQYLAPRAASWTASRAPLPPLLCEATPLAGSIPVVAPHGGVLVFLREPGATLRRGEPLVEVVNPLERRRHRAREPHGRRVLRPREPPLRARRHAHRQGRGPRGRAQW